MKLFDRMVDRINFKRLLAVYMIVAVLISIVMGAIVYRVFNDKLTFARNYIKVSDKIRQSDGSNWESIQKDLLWLAYESPDIVDILILNDENEVMFSAKGANIQRGSSTFILKKDTDRTNQKYLTIESAPNVYFKLLRLAYLPIIADILEKEQDIRSEYDDEYFYRSGFSSKKVYMLSYVVERTLGNKVYFISDVKPVPSGEMYIRLIWGTVLLYLMLYWVLTALWVYSDAKRARLNYAIWGIITLFTNLAGVFLYLAFKQSHCICFHCGAAQDRRNIYCSLCGTQINRTCPACKQVIGAEDYYCKHCAAQLRK